MITVVLLNASVAFSQEAPPPPPPTPPPGLPIDAGIVLLLAGAFGLAFYYFKNINTKKASN
nr:hypothetical protein [uncultured Flavobacterium sp.]